jgi:dTDP-4-amino-4,6-dideoxygalactose transaminase
MLYQPPAKSPAPLKAVSAAFFNREELSFEEELKAYLRALEVVIGDAWVVVLSEGLRALGDLKKGSKIILPAYSCNEFTKAILLAGLEPVYVDIDAEYRMNKALVEEVCLDDVLGVLVVNNTGFAAENEAIRCYCDEKEIFCIEDAGYTLFGISPEGNKFGSMGHVSIINMSEGKIIPAGGAAWVVNDASALDSAAYLRNKLAQVSKRSLFSEALQLFIYKVGASALGFHAYSLLKQAGLGDLKARFSSEPTRKGENYDTGELEWIGNRIQINPSHKRQLANTAARRWNKVRNAWAIEVFNKREAERELRGERVRWWREALNGEIAWFSLPEAGMPVKQPVLLKINEQQAAKLQFFGIKKQYPASWPMNQSEFPNSGICYRMAYSLPIHHGMKKGHIDRLVSYLRTIQKLLV